MQSVYFLICGYKIMQLNAICNQQIIANEVVKSQPKPSWAIIKQDKKKTNSSCLEQKFIITSLLYPRTGSP